METLTLLTMAIICPEIPRREKVDLTLSLLRLGVPQQGSSPSQPSGTQSSNESGVATPTSGQGPRAEEQRPEELIWTPNFLQLKRKRALGLATPISAPSPRDMPSLLAPI